MMWVMAMLEGTSVNGIVYINVSKEQLPTFMEINRGTYFQREGAPCNQTKPVKKRLDSSVFQILKLCSENFPELNLIENCWVMLKQNFAAHNPSSLSHLKLPIKEVWIKEITPKY